MAETLSVADMLPNKFEPKRQNRFVLAIEGIDSFLVKTSGRPKWNINSKEFKFMNSYRRIAGARGTWGGISVTLYDPIAPSGSQQVMEWIRTHHESVSGRAGYADFYKRDIQIKTVVELWDIKGAFLTGVDYTQLNYDDDGTPLEITLSIELDNCILQF
jgi:hypothetical protein